MHDTQHKTRVLAIDPGYERLGIAIIEKNANEQKDLLLYSDCFNTSAQKSFQERLLCIGEEIERVIHTYTPHVLATEQLYFTNNQKTALKVAEVRGVISYLSQKHHLVLFEYGPSQIKQAVSGYGKSTKDQVAKMVSHLITIEKPITVDDEYDAIAIGLTCFASERFT